MHCINCGKEVHVGTRVKYVVDGKIGKFLGPKRHFRVCWVEIEWEDKSTTLVHKDYVKPALKSNCFLGALAINRRLGGSLQWRSGWKRGGVSGFLGNPWGHFRVKLQDGTLLSYSAHDKNMSVWKQIWFDGYIKRTSE